MASTQRTPSEPQPSHKRTTSSVLKSLVSKKSSGALPPSSQDGVVGSNAHASSQKHTQASQDQQPLGEIQNLGDRGRKATKAENGVKDRARPNASHKRNKSAVSLKSLTGKSKEKDPGEAKSKDEDLSTNTQTTKKTKSSTSLSALLSKSRASRHDAPEVQAPYTRENMAPPLSAGEITPPPIWAQFASRTSTSETTSTTKVPLRDTLGNDDGVLMDRTHQCSPSKGILVNQQTTVVQQSPKKARPRSAIINTASFRERVDHLRGITPYPKSPADIEIDANAGLSKLEKRGSRVMAAVAAWNGKTTQAVGEELIHKPEPSAAEIEAAFEKMLDSRDTPLEVKQKMRSLTVSMKADLVKQSTPSTPLDDKIESKTPVRPTTAGRSQTTPATCNEGVEEDEFEVSGRKARPRSMTFGLGKGDQSPAKKRKQSRDRSRSRHKSVDIPRTASSTSLSLQATGSSTSLISRSPKQPVAEEFVAYLKKIREPRTVEVGKLQKLRQLLRNETVAWVDDFISQGGMSEIVDLLYRIIDIEWREEHEDTLLHNTLNCLKALLTTNLALVHLASIQARLFPSLLALLFSSGEARKGPSEYTTRGIIISLLFAYLSASAAPAINERAGVLLSQLHDPRPDESSRPPGFIAEMHRPRPYKLWCTELSNVSKEVFWIFLHNTNVVPYPLAPSPEQSFAEAHFPAPRPPVPAAPYVGGVEWDATNYLATHLDLLNGIIAALPTREERDALRQELRDSGFEKLMGGTLRLCKEKFYGGVHAGLATWVGAAAADGWYSRDVREGPPRELRSTRASPAKSSSPAKKKADAPPKLELPKLGLDGGVDDVNMMRKQPDAWI